MWLLKKLTDEATLQYLICSKKYYTVGRKNADIILNDSSISRTHCVINIAPKRECPFTVQTHTGVWVIDKKSKYGTYVQKNHEWVRLDEEQIEALPNGMIIRFGLMENIWRLEYKPLMACTSRLSAEQMKELKSQLSVVDGKLLSKWIGQCTIVIVNDVTLTVKVLLALINGIPIVTTNYIKKVVERVQTNLPLPDYKEFKPEIVESTLVSHLVSLNSEDNRKELFKGKTFVIPREDQLENLKEIIEAAGGSVQLLKLDGNWRKLAKENTIVVQLPSNKIINPDQNALEFKNLINVLKNEYHIRDIPETEIYHAIAYSSIEKYCNPKSREFELRHDTCIQNSCGDIIEEETPVQSHLRVEQQHPTTSIVNIQEDAIREDFTPSRKRACSPEFRNESKRPAFDIAVTNVEREDDDLFCESSNDIEDKPSERYIQKRVSNNFENLRISNINAGNAGQRVTYPSEKDSGNKSTLNFDYDLDEFWDCNPQKSKEEERGKRKLPEVPTEKSEFAHTEKRKRLEVTTTSSKNSENESRSDPPPLRLVKQFNKKEPNISQKLRTTTSEDIRNDPSWHLRKNANGSSREDGEMTGIVGSIGRFKKKERHSPDPRIFLSKEKIEEIGKMLEMQGWHLSHCARQRAASSTS